MSEQLAYIGIGIMCTALWIVFGIGVARMVADIKQSKFSLTHVFIWPISLCVYAAIGDVEA